ncbi:MAG: M56 family metallopeptidase [Filifactor alocis]|nr:M56 family metallopeptidase [Filifactor alocis]
MSNLSIFLFLTNLLFCSMGMLCLVYAVKKSHVQVLNFMYGRSGLLFVLTALVLLRILVPMEFWFTTTIKSQHVLVALRKAEMMTLAGGFTVRQLYLCVWLCIMTGLFIRMFCGYRRLKSIVRLLPPTKNKEVTDLMEEVGGDESFMSLPKVVEVEAEIGPFIVGGLHPVIVLPKHLSEEQRRHALLHELEHFRNRHTWIKLCMEVLSLVHWWFVPLHFLKREVLAIMELQADTYVLKRYSEKEKLSYCKSIVDVAKNRDPRSSQFCLSFATEKSVTKRRLGHILNSCQGRKRSSRTGAVLFLLSLLFFLLPFFYTFEAYSDDWESLREFRNSEGSIDVNEDNSYFLVDEEGNYLLYTDGERLDKFDFIPEGFSEFEVRGREGK